MQRVSFVCLIFLYIVVLLLILLREDGDPGHRERRGQRESEGKRQNQRDFPYSTEATFMTHTGLHCTGFNGFSTGSPMSSSEYSMPFLATPILINKLLFIMECRCSSPNTENSSWVSVGQCQPFKEQLGGMLVFGKSRHYLKNDGLAMGQTLLFLKYSSPALTFSRVF